MNDLRPLAACPVAGTEGSADLTDKVARFVLAIERGDLSDRFWSISPDMPVGYVADQIFPPDASEGRNHLLRWVRALQLRLTHARTEIDRAFLERVYFGMGAYGYRCAAMVYFGKAASQLNDQDAAFLAGLIKAPSIYGRDQTASAKRREQVLDTLRRRGLIGEMASKIPSNSEKI
ncbi:transglycosylase domain-containing protein [Labrys neptuniae]